MTVQLAGSDQPVELEALNPDFLTAELRLPKLGIPNKPKQAGLTYMTAVAWAAAKRTGAYTGELRDFLWTDCLHLEVDADAPPANPTDGAPGTDSP